MRFQHTPKQNPQKGISEAQVLVRYRCETAPSPWYEEDFSCTAGKAVQVLAELGLPAAGGVVPYRVTVLHSFHLSVLSRRSRTEASPTGST